MGRVDTCRMVLVPDSLLFGTRLFTVSKKMVPNYAFGAFTLFVMFFFNQGIFLKTIEREMMLKTNSTTIFLIYCQVMLNLFAICISAKGSDNTFVGDLWARMG